MENLGWSVETMNDAVDLIVTTVGDSEGSGSSNNHCYVTYYVHGACLGPNLKQCGGLVPQVTAHKSSPPVMQTARVALFRTFLTPITAYLRFLPLDLSRVSLLARHLFNINNVMNQILPRRTCRPGSEPFSLLHTAMRCHPFRKDLRILRRGGLVSCSIFA